MDILEQRQGLGDLDILDELIDFEISQAIVVRVKNWENNFLVGNFKGAIVAVIPYQSQDGRQNALKIARQIAAADIDYTLDYDYDA